MFIFTVRRFYARRRRPQASWIHLERQVSVDGDTDNRPIRSELKKQYPSNRELSEARAANAALALGEGGLSAVTTHGYADTRPVMPNTSDAGRSKNRRVEVLVTK